MKIQLTLFIVICLFSGVVIKFLKGETTWTKIELPVQGTLLDSDFVTPNDGWAIGVNSSILHWDGKEWKVYPSPVQLNFTAIQMLDHNNGWAVGHGGGIIQWDGKQWRQVSSPTDYSLYDISFLSPNSGWAVGGIVDVHDPGNPATLYADKVILNWDGKTWSSIPVPEQYPLNWELNSIGMVSQDEGWAAGAGEIFRWNGVEWSKFIPTLPNYEYIDFEDIQVIDAQNVWFVGHKVKTGHILHWDGTELKEVFKTNLELFAINIISPELGWAVGGNNTTNQGGSLLLKWNGTEWSEVQSPTTLPLQSIWADDQSHGWLFAGGNNPNAGYTGELFQLTEYLPPTETSTASLPTPTSAITNTDVPMLSPLFNITPTIKAVETPIPIPTKTKDYNSNLTSILIYSMILMLTLAVTYTVFQRHKKQ